MNHFKLFFQFSLCFFSLAIFAQDTLSSDLPKEEMQKLMRHLYNYRIPDVVYRDSIKNIDYTVKFIIDENGRITEPEITNKTIECPECEAELIKLMKRAPNVYPVYPDDKKVKVSYSLPFKLRIE